MHFFAIGYVPSTSRSDTGSGAISAGRWRRMQSTGHDEEPGAAKENPQERLDRRENRQHYPQAPGRALIPLTRT